MSNHPDDSPDVPRPSEPTDEPTNEPADGSAGGAGDDAGRRGSSAAWDQQSGGQPALGQVNDQQGQYPSYGQPAGYGDPGDQRPPYGQQQPGHDQYGQSQYGQNHYGSDQYGQSQYGQNQYGQNQYGQGQYGSDQYGQAPADAQQPYGVYGQQYPSSGQHEDRSRGQQPSPPDQYGQPAYGQGPYGGAPAGGQQPYPTYQAPQSYPQGGWNAAATPAGRPAVMPREVNIGSWLIAVAGLLAMIATVIQAVLFGSAQGRNTIDQALRQTGQDTQGITSAELAGAAQAFLLVGGFIALVLYVLVVVFVRRGKNWARILGTVLAVCSLLFTSLSLGGLAVLLGIVGIVMLWLRPSQPWFRKPVQTASWGG